MSKRSGMSRWQDFRRGFIDVGRFRYVLHKFDMETWRDQICFGCKLPLIEESRYFYDNHPAHNNAACIDLLHQNVDAEIALYGNEY